MKNKHPFNVPNLDKNVKLEEKRSGILIIYCLPCEEDFKGPGKLKNSTFISKGKKYYEVGLFVPYQNNMSRVLTESYYKLKHKVMLDLAYYKKKKLDRKIAKLETLKRS